MLQEKYRELLNYGEKLGITDMTVSEEGDKLNVKGTAPYQLDKDLFWDKIKTYGDWEAEIAADIVVANEDIYGIYTIQTGDSLSKIAKWHLGSPGKYMEIFNLNTDILSDPNMVKVGQKVKLPNP